ncbi:hypothetical protein VNO80_21607 [Phaseolus coccineus]|uniref:Uncharacterized protein n=1 Tax=Phaseolus coccineus TaxID=3886 RepID=A0AAN9M2R6_PHACN
MSLAPWRCPDVSRPLAMPACLSHPGDVRMCLAPWRCPHVSRTLAISGCVSPPGDARMSLAPWRCPHASRPGDVRVPLAPRRCPHVSRALAMSACLSRAGDIRMSRALAMTDDNRHAWLKVLHPTMLRPRSNLCPVADRFHGKHFRAPDIILHGPLARQGQYSHHTSVAH